MELNAERIINDLATRVADLIKQVVVKDEEIRIRDEQIKRLKGSEK